MLSNLLALGFLPGTFVLGSLALNRWADRIDGHDSTLVRHAVAFSLGLLLVVPLLAVTAAGGFYSPAFAGFVGWILTGWQFRRRQQLRWATAKSDRWLLLLAAILLVWNVTFRIESIFAGRDQGVYSNHAVHLAETGDLRAEATFDGLFTPTDFGLASAIQAGGYFFDEEAQNIYFQFSPTFALILGQGYGMAGYFGLFSVNAVLGALNAILFFGLARRFLKPGWAAAATLLFAGNLAQVWIARITLSEVLTQTWLFAGLILMQGSLSQRNRPAFLVGALLIAGCSLVRIDAYLIVLAAAMAGLALAQQPEDVLPTPDWKATGRISALAVTLVGLVSWGYGIATSPGYYADFVGPVAVMLAIAGAATLVAWIPVPPAPQRRLGELLASPWVLRAVMTAIVGLGVYAYFWRPFQEPFADFASSIGQEGRDYRENSLRDLAAYLSPLIIAAALVGLGELLRRTLQRSQLWIVPLLGVWFAYSLLYLYNPHISVDHIWKVRRFVPVVLPGFVLLGIIGLAGIAALIKSVAVRRAFVVLSLAAVFGHVGWTVRPLAFTSLQAGAVSFLQEIRRHIPEGALLVAQVNKPLFGPLQMVEKIETIRALPDDPHQQQLVTRKIEEALAANRPAALLSYTPRVANVALDATRLTLRHPSYVKTITPPPREIASRERTVFLSMIDPENNLGYRASTPRMMLGANRVHGVTESGFRKQEYDLGQPFRWTEGEASLTAPWLIRRAPVRASFRVFSTQPGGADAHMTLNGTTVFEGRIPEQGGVFAIPIDLVDWSAPQLQFTLTTETFNPARDVAGSTDDREIGVRFGGLDLQLLHPWEIGHLTFGMTPEPNIAVTGLHGAEQVGDQLARWTNGAAEFALDLPAEHPPRRLRFAQIDQGKSDPELEVYWNGARIEPVTAEAPARVVTFDIQDMAWQDPCKLELRSHAFVPAEEIPGATDQRQLGVMIGEITLEW